MAARLDARVIAWTRRAENLDARLRARAIERDRRLLARLTRWREATNR